MKQAAILITGGAGYIGSHIAYEFSKQGHTVIIVDNNQHAIEQVKPALTKSIFFNVDYADQRILQHIFSTYTIAAVIHCAASIEVGRSVWEPQLFYENNVIKTYTLLEMMRKYEVNRLIFSSSCAVYGIPHKIPITEDQQKNPLSPYGNTKLAIERMLEDYDRAYSLRFVALRYFNAAGAYAEIGLGEQHEPETHIIPLALQAAYTNQPFTIFGSDYATPDGTCIRDYLHVRDIADAHLRAFAYLTTGNQSLACNLGTGSGYSVQEILVMIEQITELKLTLRRAPRRSGDPAILVADATLARTVLAWQPIYSSKEMIIESAHQSLVIQKKSITHDFIREKTL